MKKIILFFIILCSPLMAQENNYFWLPSTANYLSPLIAGDGIRLYNSTDYFNMRVGSAYGNKILFFQNDTGDTTFALRENGRMGIGKTNPGVKFDIVGDIIATGYIKSGAGMYETGGQGFIFGASTTEGEFIYRQGNDIRFSAGGGDRFVIDGDIGGIGVGTSVPIANSVTAKLKSFITTNEATPAGTDSCASMSVVSGNGTFTSFAGDGDTFSMYHNGTNGVLDVSSGSVTVLDPVLVSGNIGNNAQQTATLGVGVTTLAITRNVITITGDGAGNTIATFTGASVGLYTFIFVDGLVTITDTDAHTANTIDLAGTATNFTSADDKVLLLVFDGTSWYQVAPASSN